MGKDDGRGISKALRVAAAGLLAGLAVACGSAEPPAAVRVGIVAPFSVSEFVTNTRSIRESAELAQREVNERGGLAVDGRRYRVVLDFEDNAGLPDETVDAARKLIHQAEVVALIGPFLSDNAMAMAMAAEASQMPMITPSATHPGVTAGRSYVFRVSFGDDFQGRALALFARQDLAAATAAVVYDVTNVYNRNIAETFGRSFAEAGGRVVAFETYAGGESSFAEPMHRVRAAAPDVVLLPNFSADVTAQVAEARRIGLKATLLGSDAWDSEAFAPRPEFQGTFFSSIWNPAIASPRGEVFIRTFRDAFRHLPKSDAALTYDALGLLFQAIETAGSLKSSAIRRSLAATEGYPGATGVISYRGHGEPVRSLFLLRFEDGRVVFHREILPGPGGQDP